MPLLDKVNTLKSFEFEAAVKEGLNSEGSESCSGVFSTFTHSWLACGPNLFIVGHSDGELRSSWTFGGDTNDLVEITCAVELQFERCSIPLLIVGVSSGSVHQIYFFNPNTRKILRTINFNYPVRVLCLIEDGLSVVNPLNEALAGTEGLLAVGCADGSILVVDLCRSTLLKALNGDFWFFTGESAPVELSTLPVGQVTSAAVQDKLAECRSSRGRSCLALDLTEEDTDDGITAFCYSLESAILFVGTSSGSFLLWNMTSLSCLYLPQSVPRSVLSLNTLEPCDDPRHNLYLWICYEEHPQAVMYCISFASKFYVQGYGTYYQGFESAGIVYRLALSSEENPSSVRAVNAIAVSKSIPKSQSNCFSVSGSDSSQLRLFVTAYEGNRRGEEDDGGMETFAAVFDLNQWYKEQMPEAGQRVCVERLALGGGRGLRHLALDLSSLCHYQWVRPLEEHFHPSALDFRGWCLEREGLRQLEKLGSQSQWLRNMSLVGPSALLSPGQLFHGALAAGLLPTSIEPPDPESASPEEQRKYILTVCLENQATLVIEHCALEWSTGGLPVAGCTLAFLLTWLWELHTAYKSQANRICVPLFDQSGLRFDEGERRSLQHCKFLLSTVQTLYTNIIHKYRNFILIDGLEQKLTAMSLVRFYFDCCLKLISVSLLPEPNDVGMPTSSVPYKYDEINQYAIKRRVEQGLLLADSLLESDEEGGGGARAMRQWADEGGRAAYPPPNIQSLLRYSFQQLLTLCCRRVEQGLLLADSLLESDEEGGGGARAMRQWADEGGRAAYPPPNIQSLLRYSFQQLLTLCCRRVEQGLLLADSLLESDEEGGGGARAMRQWADEGGRAAYPPPNIQSLLRYSFQQLLTLCCRRVEQGLLLADSLLESDEEGGGGARAMRQWADEGGRAAYPPPNIQSLLRYSFQQLLTLCCRRVEQGLLLADSLLESEEEGGGGARAMRQWADEGGRAAYHPRSIQSLLRYSFQQLLTLCCRRVEQGLLLADSLLESEEEGGGGARAMRQWADEGGRAAYPPPSIQSHLRYSFQQLLTLCCRRVEQGLLLADSLLESEEEGGGGARAMRQWADEGGRAAYPPPSIQSHLRYSFQQLLTLCCRRVEQGLLLADSLLESDEEGGGGARAMRQWADEGGRAAYPPPSIQSHLRYSFQQLLTLCCRRVEQGLLLADSVLESDEEGGGGARAMRQWADEGGRAAYPPPSIQSLLRYCLHPAPSHPAKLALLIYLYMDIVHSLTPIRSPSGMDRVHDLQYILRIPEVQYKIVSAFWYLDHSLFHEGVSLLLDSKVLPVDLSEVQHRSVLRLLSTEDEARLALQYLRLKTSNLHTLADLRLELDLLLKNRLINEAFMFQRKHSDHREELLFQFFEGCLRKNLLGQVFGLNLDPKEESILFKFLSSSEIKNKGDLQVLLLLSRAKYREAVSLNERLRLAAGGSTPSGTDHRPSAALTRDLIVRGVTGGLRPPPPPSSAGTGLKSLTAGSRLRPLSSVIKVRSEPDGPLLQTDPSLLQSAALRCTRHLTDFLRRRQNGTNGKRAHPEDVGLNGAEELDVEGGVGDEAPPPRKRRTGAAAWRSTGLEDAPGAVWRSSGAGDSSAVSSLLLPRTPAKTRVERELIQLVGTPLVKKHGKRFSLDSSKPSSILKDKNRERTHGAASEQTDTPTRKTLRFARPEQDLPVVESRKALFSEGSSSPTRRQTSPQPSVTPPPSGEPITGRKSIHSAVSTPEPEEKEAIIESIRSRLRSSQKRLAEGGGMDWSRLPTAASQPKTLFTPGAAGSRTTTTRRPTGARGAARKASAGSQQPPPPVAALEEEEDEEVNRSEVPKTPRNTSKFADLSIFLTSAERRYLASPSREGESSPDTEVLLQGLSKSFIMNESALATTHQHSTAEPEDSKKRLSALNIQSSHHQQKPSTTSVTSSPDADHQIPSEDLPPKSQTSDELQEKPITTSLEEEYISPSKAPVVNESGNEDIDLENVTDSESSTQPPPSIGLTISAVGTISHKEFEDLESSKSISGESKGSEEEGPEFINEGPKAAASTGEERILRKEVHADNDSRDSDVVCLSSDTDEEEEAKSAEAESDNEAAGEESGGDGEEEEYSEDEKYITSASEENTQDIQTSEDEEESLGYNDFDGDLDYEILGIPRPNHQQQEAVNLVESDESSNWDAREEAGNSNNMETAGASDATEGRSSSPVMILPTITHSIHLESDDDEEGREEEEGSIHTPGSDEEIDEEEEIVDLEMGDRRRSDEECEVINDDSNDNKHVEELSDASTPPPVLLMSSAEAVAHHESNSSPPILVEVTKYRESEVTDTSILVSGKTMSFDDDIVEETVAIPRPLPPQASLQKTSQPVVGSSSVQETTHPVESSSIGKTSQPIGTISLQETTQLVDSPSAQETNSPSVDETIQPSGASTVERSTQPFVLSSVQKTTQIIGISSAQETSEPLETSSVEPITQAAGLLTVEETTQHIESLVEQTSEPIVVSSIQETTQAIGTSALQTLEPNEISVEQTSQHVCSSSVDQTTQPIGSSSIEQTNEPFVLSSIQEKTQPIGSLLVKETTQPVGSSSLDQITQPIESSSIQETIQAIGTSSVGENTEPIGTSSVEETTKAIGILSVVETTQPVGSSSVELNTQSVESSSVEPTNEAVSSSSIQKTTEPIGTLSDDQLENVTCSSKQDVEISQGTEESQEESHLDTESGLVNASAGLDSHQSPNVVSPSLDQVGTSTRDNVPLASQAIEKDQSRPKVTTDQDKQVTSNLESGRVQSEFHTAIDSVKTDISITSSVNVAAPIPPDEVVSTCKKTDISSEDKSEARGNNKTLSPKDIPSQEGSSDIIEGSLDSKEPGKVRDDVQAISKEVIDESTPSASTPSQETPPILCSSAVPSSTQQASLDSSGTTPSNNQLFFFGRDEKNETYLRTTEKATFQVGSRPSLPKEEEEEPLDPMETAFSQTDPVEEADSTDPRNTCMLNLTLNLSDDETDKPTMVDRSMNTDESYLLKKYKKSSKSIDSSKSSTTQNGDRHTEKHVPLSRISESSVKTNEKSKMSFGTQTSSNDERKTSLKVSTGCQIDPSFTETRRSSKLDASDDKLLNKHSRRSSVSQSSEIRGILKNVHDPSCSSSSNLEIHAQTEGAVVEDVATITSHKSGDGRRSRTSSVSSEVITKDTCHQDEEGPPRIKGILKNTQHKCEKRPERGEEELSSGGPPEKEHKGRQRSRRQSVSDLEKTDEVPRRLSGRRSSGLRGILKNKNEQSDRVSISSENTSDLRRRLEEDFPDEKKSRSRRYSEEPDAFGLQRRTEALRRKTLHQQDYDYLQRKAEEDFAHLRRKSNSLHQLLNEDVQIKSNRHSQPSTSSKIDPIETGQIHGILKNKSESFAKESIEARLEEPVKVKSSRRDSSGRRSSVSSVQEEDRRRRRSQSEEPTGILKTTSQLPELEEVAAHNERRRRHSVDSHSSGDDVPEKRSRPSLKSLESLLGPVQRKSYGGGESSRGSRYDLRSGDSSEDKMEPDIERRRVTRRSLRLSESEHHESEAAPPRRRASLKPGQDLFGKPLSTANKPRKSQSLKDFPVRKARASRLLQPILEEIQEETEEDEEVPKKKMRSSDELDIPQLAKERLAKWNLDLRSQDHTPLAETECLTPESYASERRLTRTQKNLLLKNASLLEGLSSPSLVVSESSGGSSTPRKERRKRTPSIASEGSPLTPTRSSLRLQKKPPSNAGSTN